MKPKYTLSDMEYDEVSFVERGANSQAHVVLFKSVKQAERDEAAEEGLAFSDGSYPIRNQGDLVDAWNLRNNSKKHSESEVVAHIKRVAAKLGLKVPGDVEKNNPTALDVHMDSPYWKKKRKKMTGNRGTNQHTRTIQCPTCSEKMTVVKSATCTCGTVVMKGSSAGPVASLVGSEVMAAVLDLGTAIVKCIRDEADLSEVAKAIQGFADHVGEEYEDWSGTGVDEVFISGVTGDVKKSLDSGYEELSKMVGATPVVQKSDAKVDMPKTPEDIAKSLKDGDPLKEVLQGLISTVNKNSEELEIAKEEKLTGAWVAKAKKWTHLAGTPEDMGAQLRGVEKSLGTEAAEKLAASFASAQKVAEQSNIFKSSGTSRTGNADSVSGKIGARIAELRKSGAKEEDPILYARVLEENPELYDEYLAEEG